MRAVIQRVKCASVSVAGEVVGVMDSAAGGVLIFLGIGHDDSEHDLTWLVRRIAKLRIFEDETGRMNCSLVDVHAGAMVISQFTLFGNLRKGNRPSFNRAALSELAVPLYEAFCMELSEALGQQVAQGRFGENMQIDVVNDGPVTLVVDTKARNF
ncbi:MAG TPA: D-tyrosyl-tRNA(Tyr) deacylase [Opitutae bacterium]|nr:D-tyrosyl-tRNA(Tyr) deacylase [Opitutae bacterium]